MRHFKLKLAAAITAMTALASFSAFAATAISNVNFTYTIEGENAISSGYNEPTVTADSTQPFEISDLSVSSSDTSSITGKSALTYTLTLSADSGYYFPNANSITVTGNNTTEITKKTTSTSDNTILTIKFKAYPYYRLSVPSFATDFDSIKGDSSKTVSTGRATTLNINKNGASKVEYVISYVDQYGEYKTKNGTTTGSSISVGTYNKQYTGSSSERQSCYIIGIAIRSAGLSGSNPYVAPSEWVYIAGGSSSIDTEEYFTDYSTWDDFISSSGSSSSSSGTASSNVNIFGWQGSGNSWYYYNNGVRTTGWVYDGSSWYYCNASDGAMVAGWIQDSTGNWFFLNTTHDGTYGCLKAGWVYDGGNWYYLHTSHDGTYGAMKTGWVTVNGKTYYFRTNAGGPLGSMVTGTQYINGRNYTFGADGALIG